MKVFNLVAILFLFHSFRAAGQDTVRIMYYNLLNFPDDSPERVIELRQIVGYAQPDILVVNELLSETGANLILAEGLNVWGMGDYAAAEYFNGPDTDNMLYYNTAKLGLAGQEQIPTGLRDISEYKLYYKSPGLGAMSDTVFMHIYSVHLKAGSGFYNQRKEEALVVKYHLNTLPNPENILLGGDFNFYSGNESGCLALRETGSIDLFDPIDQIGDWNNNFLYREIHTQSTRSAPLSDGAGGGMDDRFDLIFISEDVFDNTNGLSVISGSYQALGQDGERFNDEINSPFNPTVPDSIADALYYMSDHLPVMMDLKTDYTASISKDVKPNVSWFYNPTTNELIFSGELETGSFTLYDLRGAALWEMNISNIQQIQLPQHIAQGLFIWTLTTPDNQYKDKLVLSN